MPAWVPCQQITVVVEDSLKRTSKPVFSDVFAFADALPVPVRLRLSVLLAMPGKPPAILPRQLASCLLPADPEARAAIRTAIEAGVTAQTIEKLAPHRLDAVVPALARCAPDALVPVAPVRVRALLEKHRIGTAPPLAGFTIGQIGGWSGFGPTRMVQLIDAAVGAALEMAAPEGSVLPARAIEPDRRLTVFAEALAAAGDVRDRGLFENGVLPLGPTTTRPEMADALEISVDRVNRLLTRAAQRVEAALDHAPTEDRELAAAVSERLGAASPRTAADEMVASLGFPALPDTRSRLLLWLAGPYLEVDGHPDWVAVDPARLVGQTRRLIHEDGGVRPVEHVAKDLRIEGIVAEHVEGWLARQPVRVSDGLVVATTGRPGDVAERALHAHGRPMTVDEIAAWVHGVPHGFQELRSAPGRRFVVTRGEALALAEWGEWGQWDEWGARPDNATDPTRNAAPVGGPVAEERAKAHYPDGHGTRISRVPTSRSALAVG